MNLTSLTHNIILRKQKLRIDKPIILLVLPDTNVKLIPDIYNSNIMLLNLAGIISPGIIFSMGGKRFNGRVRYLEAKKQMLSVEPQTGRKFKVLLNAPVTKEIPSNMFYIYDMTIWSNAIPYIYDRFALKTVIKIILDEISNTYVRLKESIQVDQIETMFLVKNQQGHLYEILKHMRTLVPKKELEEYRLFDNFLLVNDCENVIIPLLYKEDNKTVLSLPNYQKLSMYIEAAEQANQLDQEIESKETKEDKKEDKFATLTKTPVDKAAEALKSAPVKVKTIDIDKTTFTVNQNSLKKALKTFKINNADIIAAIKNSLEDYIKVNKTKPDKQDAENLLLKSIHYTIHGTDQIKDEYIANPNLLFHKLTQINTYQTPLKIPERDDEIIRPSNIISLKYTTGQHRQLNEFKDEIHNNIKRLFTSLENVSQYPIKVKNISWKVEDDNYDRFIRYKITLQNLNGGYKEPYDIELKVPSPVNEKYFKLHSGSYIMASQQFLRPITKTNKNEVRLISSYGIVTIKLINLKFGPDDLREIYNYIRIKYPKLIKSIIDPNKLIIEFNDNSVISILLPDDDNIVYKDDKTIIKLDKDTNKLIDKDGNKLNQGYQTFVYQTLINKIKSVNPDDNFGKKSLPYLAIYLGSFTIPLIVYLWLQKGLLNALNDYGVNYEIVDSMSEDGIYVPLKDKKYLLVKPDTIKEQLLVNGLTTLKFKKEISNPDDISEIQHYLTDIYGSRAIWMISLLTENFIDPVTKELLEFENLPTNFVNLISPAVDKLMNDPIDSLADLKIYRSRLSEMILHSLYKQIKMAHNRYKTAIELSNGQNDTEKLWFDPDYVIKDMITEMGVLQNTEPVNPVDEIMLSSKVIKTGKGGVPNKRSFKLEHRNIHPSQYGIIGANSTSESADVGIVTYHTLTPLIINRYGAYGVKNINAIDGWNTLCLDEALTPFMNEVDSDRMCLARTHSNQVTPIKESEVPLIQSGAESIVPQLASTRFVQLAKKDGTVVEVIPNKYMTVRYNDGTVESIDILPRYGRTKRAAKILLSMNTLKVGDKFKANQLIAWTNNFRKDKYCAGKNVFIAVMNYEGYSHEDAYCISKELADNTHTEIVETVQVVIPPNCKITSMISEKNTQVKQGDLILEYTMEDPKSTEEYIEMYKQAPEDAKEEGVSIAAEFQNTIKHFAPCNGEIIDIKIHINNKLNLDKYLLNLYNNQVKDYKNTLSKLVKSKDEDKQLNATDNMDVSIFKIGGHKLKGVEFKGAKITYLIKREKSLQIGDKLSNRYGAKGVISKILDPAPYGEITPRIDVFISPISIFSRKNIAFIKELYLGKIFYFANQKLAEMANDSKVTNSSISQFIIDLYETIGLQKITDEVKQRIKDIGIEKIRKGIKNGTFKLYLIVEPFEKVEFSNIKNAANLIKIPLEEKVYIPSLKQWTKYPVPVGVSYYEFLEHYSDVYSNIRGIGRFQSLTKQPTKGKSKEGGQSIANLDIYAFLTYNANNILNELLGPRSDEHSSKRELYNKIIETGELADLTLEKTGGTKKVFDLFITGLGLEIR